MPLTGTGAALAQLIVNELNAQGHYTDPPSQLADSLSKFTSVCNKVVEHIVANSNVRVTVLPLTFSQGTSPAVAPNPAPVPIDGIAGGTGGIL